MSFRDGDFKNVTLFFDFFSKKYFFSLKTFAVKGKCLLKIFLITALRLFDFDCLYDINHEYYDVYAYFFLFTPWCVINLSCEMN